MAFEKRFSGRVDAHVDVGALPGVGRVDVVGAGRRGAHQVAHRPQQHVVARPRPGLVHQQLVVAVEARVVEEVERLPALALGDAEGRDLGVEVVGAVHVAGVAHVLVVLGLAGEPEHVVAADRVAHHLHQRVHVDVVELAVDPRCGHRRAHQRARGHAVQAALEPLLQLVLVEGEEVRALLALHVDDLDELALAHLVGQRRRPVHAEVEPRLGQRRRQLQLGRGTRACPLELDHERRGRRVAVHEAPAGSCHHQQRVALAFERLRRARGAARTEQAQRPGVVRAQPPRVQHAQEAVVGAALHHAPQHAGRGVRGHAQRTGIVAPVRGEHRQLGGLAAVGVDHGHAVAREQLHHRRGARPHPPRLERGVRRAQPRYERWRNRRHYALAAGSRDSSLSACSESCLASSRLPAASSFLTSFSTTRRL